MTVFRLIVTALLVTACTPEQPVDKAPQEPVVVYAAFAEDEAVGRLFDRYREATGAVVIHRYGDAQAIVDDLIRNDISPPADVLITRSATGAWRAAEESALRPLFSEALHERVPDWARDADDLWYAMSADIAVIASSSGGDDIADSFASLADAAFAGRLCLSSSRNAINLAAIAMMISQGGIRDTELAVRGWVDNLAAPPFATEAELAAAIAAGDCGTGILSRSVTQGSDGLEFQLPESTIATISAVGIGRHARNPDGAQELIEWLIDELPPIDAGELPLVNASTAAWNAEDARKLAERARYR